MTIKLGTELVLSYADTCYSCVNVYILYWWVPVAQLARVPPQISLDSGFVMIGVTIVTMWFASQIRDGAASLLGIRRSRCIFGR